MPEGRPKKKKTKNTSLQFSSSLLWTEYVCPSQPAMCPSQPTNPYNATLTFNAPLPGGGSQVVLRVEIAWWDSCPSRKRHEKTCFLSLLHTVCRHDEKTAVCTPGREPSPRIPAYRHPDLALSASRSMRKYMRVVQAPCLWCLLWQPKPTGRP